MTSKKKQVASSVGNNDLMRLTLEQIYTSSLLARQNASVISAPGWGKTKISYYMGKQVAGSDGLVFLDLSPSTPPERITGPISIPDLKNGVLKYNIDNTLYDPKSRVVVLDELYRSNEIVFDMLIHATNDVTRTDAPVFWATSNFISKSNRTVALLDRFALWYWHEAGEVDIDSVVHSDGIECWNFDLPSMQEVMDVRSADYTARSRKAISHTLENLRTAIGKEKFVLNPRRVEAWREILFRNMVYLTGTNDFDDVHPDAISALRYAYPVTSSEEFRKWQSIASTIIDAVGTAIETYMGIARQKFNQVVENCSNANERSAMLAELATVLADCEEELTRLSGTNDKKRVEEAILLFNKWFKQAAQGKKIPG